MTDNVTDLPAEAQEGQESATAAPAKNYLQLAQQAFEGSTSYLDTNYRTQWEKNLRQFRSMHPTNSRYLTDAWKTKNKFFRPKTRAAVRKAEAALAAALFSTSDVVDISAIDDNDDLQQASAALWKEAMNYRLKKSVPWFLTVLGAFQDGNVMGAVVSHQDWNEADDRPDVDIRPLENIRIDPGARWTDPINTSPYVIDMIAMYVHEVKDRKDWVQPTSDSEYLTAKCNLDSTRLVREGNRTDPKEGANTGITDFDLVWVHRNILRDGGQDVVYYTLGTQHMLSKEPVPLKEAYPWLRRRKRPYTMGVCVVETHRMMPSAPVELAAPVQSEINTLVNQRRDNVDLVLNKRYFIRRGAQVDVRSLVRGSAGSATMMNDTEKDVKALEWNDVTGSAYQEEDRLNLDHDDLMGTFSGSSVASNRRLNETVGGMNLLSTEMNEIGDYTIKAFIETWLELTLEQVLWLEQHYETDEMILALAGRRAKLVEKFGIEVIDDQLLRQDVMLEINVGMGQTNPANAVERFMAAIGRLRETFGEDRVSRELKFEAVTSELFGKLGYKDGSRFLVNTDNPEMAALQQENDMLRDELKRKRSPELEKADATLKRAQAVKTSVEAIFGATQAAGNIAAVAEIAPVADEVLAAAGYTPPEQSSDPNLPTASVPGATAKVTPNTSPLQPGVPVSPAAGVNAGIEGGDQ